MPVYIPLIVCSCEVLFELRNTVIGSSPNTLCRVFGLLVAWKFSNRKEFLAAIRSQPGKPYYYSIAFNDLTDTVGSYSARVQFHCLGYVNFDIHSLCGTVTRDSVCALQLFRIVLLLWSTILSGILLLFLRVHVFE
ncbi:hypothetical protein V1515DRAFT_452193 [Lipomyces mesembrius]